MPAEAPAARLPRAVVMLGLVSLLTDASSEMIFPLLPAFLAARFPGSAAQLLGLMEGAAELVSALLKLQSGRWADRAARLKPLVLLGYGVSTAVRPVMGLVTAPWHPVLVRALDRVGKGVRSSPRDALIAHAVAPEARGRAFGFHRGMDHAGAVVGALLAMGLVALGLTVERVFLLSAVPGALALVALALVREPARAAPRAPEAGAPAARVPGRLGWYLGPVALFGLANATDGFLLLKLAEEGAAPALLPLAWLVLHAVKSAASFPAGALADRLGAARVVAAGWALYAGAFAALALVRGVPATFAVIALYGLYHALAEGAEKSLLTALVPAAVRGRAFGLYNGLQGGTALAAGLAFGRVWTVHGSRAAFLAAGAVALASAALLVALLPRARGAGPAPA